MMKCVKCDAYKENQIYAFEDYSDILVKTTSIIFDFETKFLSKYDIVLQFTSTLLIINEPYL